MIRSLEPKKHRSRYELIEAILRTANGGASQSRIRYGACMTHSDVKLYLDFLVRKRLLLYDQYDRLFSLTQRGLHVLRTCERLHAMTGMTKMPTGGILTEREGDDLDVEIDGQHDGRCACGKRHGHSTLHGNRGLFVLCLFGSLLTLVFLPATMGLQPYAAATDANGALGVAASSTSAFGQYLISGSWQPGLPQVPPRTDSALGLFVAVARRVLVAGG